MKRFFDLTESMMSTLISFGLFAILLVVFIMIFFFPEQAGIIVGKFMRGIDSMLNQ